MEPEGSLLHLQEPATCPYHRRCTDNKYVLTWHLKHRVLEDLCALLAQFKSQHCVKLCILIHSGPAKDTTALA
jgi:hypothetical protein